MKKIITDFSKYTLIGVIISIMIIFFTWLLIDIIHIHTFIATASVVVVFHVIKFLLYRGSNLFDREMMGRTQFILYTIIVVFSSILHILLVWYLVDMAHLPTLFSVTVVIAGLFVMRFVLFKSLHLIGNNLKKEKNLYKDLNHKTLILSWPLLMEEKWRRKKL
ncbi:MAG: hypothetical protein JSW00_01155 [Thermoplasmata archaeon]|nr:MAG: hypothetical protein JSW00_01155 [Thermoplasmata archaeon]